MVRRGDNVNFEKRKTFIIYLIVSILTTVALLSLKEFVSEAVGDYLSKSAGGVCVMIAFAFEIRNADKPLRISEVNWIKKLFLRKKRSDIYRKINKFLFLFFLFYSVFSFIHAIVELCK